MHILVSTPYPLSSPKGNTITAKRIVRLLQEAGHTAEAIHTDMPGKADVMIALHATKTLTGSKYFKAHHPESLLITYLTGTDLYKDQPNQHPAFFESLMLSDKLVVSQKASLLSVPKEVLSKCHFVAASVLLPPLEAVAKPPANSLVLAAHLRPVKNPFLINRALACVPDAAVEVFALGAALEPGMKYQVEEWQTKESRFHWLDNVPYAQALSWMQQAAFTLNTSHSEGGSNAVAESIVLGTPVLATNIEGNRGMLGDDYLGLFEPDNPNALADLMVHCLHDCTFRQRLMVQTERLQQDFSPQRETQGWLNLFS